MNYLRDKKWIQRLMFLLIFAITFTPGYASIETCKHIESCESSSTAYKLHNEQTIDLLGFGTAGLGEQTYSSVREAVRAGFRHFDSAQASEWYREADVGSAIADAIEEEPGLKREDFSIVTKVHPRDFRPEKLLQSFEESLSNLKTDYIDVLLLHFPSCWPDGSGPGHCPPGSGTWEDVWTVLEDLYKKGRVKALGVSNFDVALLNKLWSQAEIKPHVVQNWFDPFHQEKDVRTWCHEHSVLFSGYSTFGSQWVWARGLNESPVFSSEIFHRLGDKYQRPITEVVLSWALQLGVAVLPRSSKATHIQSNAMFLSFEEETFLLEDELRELEKLDGIL